MTSFADLRQANFEREQEWDPDHKITIAFSAVELAGEIGELCNVIKKIEREKMGLKGSRASEQDLAEELADAIICVDLLAMRLGINLADCVPKKFNKTSHKYGLSVRMGGT